MDGNATLPQYWSVFSWTSLANVLITECQLQNILLSWSSRPDAGRAFISNGCVLLVPHSWGMLDDSISVFMPRDRVLRIISYTVHNIYTDSCHSQVYIHATNLYNNVQCSYFLFSQPLSSKGSICRFEYMSLKSEPSMERSPSSRITPCHANTIYTWWTRQITTHHGSHPVTQTQFTQGELAK